MSQHATGAHDGQDGPASARFVLDIDAIRKRARAHIDRGTTGESYRADRATVISLLDEALATEIVCVLRYKRHAISAPRVAGIAGQAIANELGKYAAEEQIHADRIAARIAQLGEEPDYDPSTLTTRAHSQYVAGGSLHEMLREDLVAERIAIEAYREIIRYLGDRDPTSRRMMEDILAEEEGHAEELSDWIERLTTPGRAG